MAMSGKGADARSTVAVGLRQTNVLFALSASFGQLVAETVLAAVFRFRCPDLDFLPCVILPIIASFATGNGLVAGRTRGWGITPCLPSRLK